MHQPSEHPNPHTHSITDAARLLGVSRASAYAWKQAGTLAVVVDDRGRERVLQATIDAILGTAAGPETASAPEPPPAVDELAVAISRAVGREVTRRPWYSTEEVAEIIDVPVRSVVELVRRGSLGCAPGSVGVYRIRVIDIERWLGISDGEAAA